MEKRDSGRAHSNGCARRYAAFLLALSACFGCGRVELDEGPRLIGFDPPAESSELDRRPLLRVFYDRPIAPSAFTRASASLESGPSRVYLSLEVDPVNNALLATPFGGRVLEPHIEYFFLVDGVRDLDGVLAEPIETSFVTGDAVEGPPLLELATFDEAIAIFRRSCVDGCHGGASPDQGLDLSNAEGIRRTALGIPATQTGGRLTYGSRGLAGMALVEVLGGRGRPAASYLVYKMLGDPHILGERMPPDGASSREEIARIAAWIRAGAPTPD